MPNEKQTQQGKNPQPETKKDHPELAKAGKPEQKSTSQEMDHKEEKAIVSESIGSLASVMAPPDKDALIKELTDKLAAATAANQGTSPDAKRIAAEALKKVQEQRKKDEEERARNPQAAAGNVSPSGKQDRWPERKRKSTVSNPVNFVWELAEAMIGLDPQARRKDIINAAIDAGVAGYTARTQYQAWYQARRESQRQASLAAAKAQNAVQGVAK